MSIWQTMMPTLDENVIRTLASKYDYSGGQIENIARHYTINNILHGQADNIVEILTAYCDSERLETKEMHKIGFYFCNVRIRIYLSITKSVTGSTI